MFCTQLTVQINDFVKAIPDGNSHIMFTCQKYREGSDIKGIEMNTIVISGTIEPYILVQVAGRTLRKEYQGKEGWCNIFKKADNDKETAEEALYEIFKRLTLEYDLFSVETSNGELTDIDKIQAIIREYVGEIKIDTKCYEKDEAVKIINRLYTRENSNKITYEYCRKVNATLKLNSRHEFNDLFDKGKYSVDLDNRPQFKFKDKWISWYDFLSVDTSQYPRTIQEWTEICKENGVKDSITYDELVMSEKYKLPQSPSEMYDKGFTNYEKLFPQLEEIVEW